MTTAVTACPDPRKLEALLRDELPAGEQEALTDHVGACPGCQQRLDHLAQGPEPLRPDGPVPPSDSAFWPAVERLQQEITRLDTAATPRPDPGIRLDFLSPPADPADL